MKDYYEILGLTKEVSQLEIKKAYFSLIRKFPPDRFPDDFMKIREAYEILFDEVTRQEYDVVNKMPDIVKVYFSAGKEALESGDSEKAIELLERVTKKYPKFSIVNKLLGEAYLENENYGKALEIFEKLVKNEPNNAGFIGKLAHAYLNRGWHKKAAKTYQQALSFDEDNISLWLGLIQSYMNAKELKNAEKVALEAIEVSKKNGWDGLELYYHVILSDILSNNIEGMNKHIEDLKKTYENNEDQKENVAWFLISISKFLQRFGQAEYSEILIKTAVELIPDNEEINKIKEETNKNKDIIININRLKKDLSIDPIFTELFEFESEKCGEKACLDCEFNQFSLEMDIITDIDTLRKDIITLRNSYPVLYKLKYQFLNDILNKNKLESLMFSYRKKMERFMKLCPEKFEDEIEEIEEMLPLQPYKRDESKVGRNDPCTCGSGKKYKKCCGR